MQCTATKVQERRRRSRKAPNNVLFYCALVLIPVGLLWYGWTAAAIHSGSCRLMESYLLPLRLLHACKACRRTLSTVTLVLLPALFGRSGPAQISRVRLSALCIIHVRHDWLRMGEQCFGIRGHRDWDPGAVNPLELCQEAEE